MAVNVYASAFVWKPEAEIECPTRAAVLRGQRIDPIWDLDLVPIARSPTSLIDRMSTKIGATFILSSLTDKIPSLIFFFLSFHPCLSVTKGSLLAPCISEADCVFSLMH